MDFPGGAGRTPGLRLAIAAFLASVAALLAPAAAVGANGQVRLVLQPVGQPGTYFDLTMAPGETRTVAVRIANSGDAPVAARTYAADVYTIIDGGFGARLRNEPQTGTTTWLNYPMEVTNLVAGQATVRPFEIRVPGDAGPGEYITSIVLENDQPIADSGTVGTNQIIRQAVGVVVTVPGTRSPGLAIGAASARTFAGRSVVSVGVANTGNVRLKPVALLTITDAGGGQVGQSRIQMDSFYALTRTLIEVPLPAVLAPGTYIVRVALADSSQNVGVERAAIALVVEGAPATDSRSGGSGDLTSITQVTDEHALPVVAIALIAALMLGSGVLAGVVSFALLRRRGAAG